MRDVTYVVPYEENATIKKIIFENGMTLDLFPNVQEILYLYRQCEITASEAGGLLLGYENAINGNFTLSTITEPQITDVRTRFSLFLGNLHQKTAKKTETTIWLYRYMAHTSFKHSFSVQYRSV